MGYLDKKIDYVMTVAEEISLTTGLVTSVTKNNTIEVDTIAGKIEYDTTYNKNHMIDVYRFIMIYGGRLSRYGLKMKLKEEL